YLFKKNSPTLSILKISHPQNKSVPNPCLRRRLLPPFFFYLGQHHVLLLQTQTKLLNQHRSTTKTKSGEDQHHVTLPALPLPPPHRLPLLPLPLIYNNPISVTKKK
ncbi:hypothetical protein Tsubulata_047302, partial [Turnera subulata]